MKFSVKKNNRVQGCHWLTTMIVITTQKSILPQREQAHT